MYCCPPKQLRTVFKICSTTAGIRQAKSMPCVGYARDPGAYTPGHSLFLNGLPTSLEELCSFFTMTNCYGEVNDCSTPADYVKDRGCFTEEKYSLRAQRMRENG